jgi:hypothetical protein
MLPPMRLVDQLIDLERTIDGEWTELRLRVTVADPSQVSRAAALLGPANPGRRGNVLLFAVDRTGPGIGLIAARRLLRLLDAEGIVAELELVNLQKPAPEEVRRKKLLREQWDRQVEALPSDWSDLYAQVRFDSSDYLERAALLLAPTNPMRGDGIATFRFRSARRFGYGVSAQMAARCFTRCDDERITGSLEILHVLSDTHPVATQGPVWFVGGRNV